jgi:hypothetical protein
VKLDFGSDMTLRTAPPGLLMTRQGRLLFKTEYGDNDGRLDIYIVASGEYYWGDVQDRIKCLDELCCHVSLGFDPTAHRDDEASDDDGLEKGGES